MTCNHLPQERSYPPPMEPGEALALLDSMDKELLDSPAVTKEIIGDRPNTYTFTKVEHYSILHYAD